MAVHTSGSLLQWHPHAHSCCLNGTVDEEDNFHQLNHIDTALLEELFAEKVFRFLLEKELITQETADLINSWNHSGFNIWAGEPIDPENAEQRLFISRYLLKCPVALNRITITHNLAGPTIRYYEDAELGDSGAFKDFSPLAFLAELQQHVAAPREQPTRFYGRYACRTRGAIRREREFQALLENNFEPLEQSLPIESTKISTLWATWIKRVFEVDPLICRKCGGQMKIKSFLHDSNKIKKLCDNLGIPDWRAPPPLEHTSSNLHIDTSPEFVQ